MLEHWHKHKIQEHDKTLVSNDDKNKYLMSERRKKKCFIEFHIVKVSKIVRQYTISNNFKMCNRSLKLHLNIQWAVSNICDALTFEFMVNWFRCSILTVNFLWKMLNPFLYVWNRIEREIFVTRFNARAHTNKCLNY